ncbi:MAG: tyrosine-protein phosphatase [Lysobacteraceae bacterium]
MIDLHCHMLPGIDDGAPDLETALAMARIAVDDGITVTACTPHIYPGLYENDGDGIRRATAAFQSALDEAGIPLRLVVGADVHLQPGLGDGLRDGWIPSINGSRYFLFEPPHHVAPPRIEDTAFNLMAAGWVPVVTHPERLSWIDSHYDVFTRMAHAGCWMQLTAGAITGRFGRRVKHWSERMLDEGLVSIVATDAHNTGSRAPLLAEAREACARRLGEAEAGHLVLDRPQGILDNRAPSELPGLPERARPVQRGWLQRLFGTA